MIILTAYVSLLVTVESGQCPSVFSPHLPRQTLDGSISALPGPRRPSEAEARTSTLPGPEFIPKGHCRAN